MPLNHGIYLKFSGAYCYDLPYIPQLRVGPTGWSCPELPPGGLLAGPLPSTTKRPLFNLVSGWCFRAQGSECRVYDLELLGLGILDIRLVRVSTLVQVPGRNADSVEN